MNPLTQTVLLFGEVLADTFPEYEVLGGAPFNVARHLRAFGLNPVLITSIGQDDLGMKVLQVMQSHTMDTSGIQRSQQNLPTGRAVIHQEPPSHYFEILPHQAYDYIDPASALATSIRSSPTLIYFGTLAQRHPISRAALDYVLNSSDAAKFLDINLRMPWYSKEVLAQSLHACNILKLNTDELATLAKTLDLPMSQPGPILNVIMEKFAIDQVILTCGAEGACQFHRDGSHLCTSSNQPTTNIVDSVGAGDAFSAVFILGEIEGWSTQLTLNRANSFASALCGIRGAIPESTQFYQPFIDNWALKPT